jgi:hypothetical protein
LLSLGPSLGAHLGNDACDFCLGFSRWNIGKRLTESLYSARAFFPVNVTIVAPRQFVLVLRRSHLDSCLSMQGKAFRRRSFPTDREMSEERVW